MTVNDPLTQAAEIITAELKQEEKLNQAFMDLHDQWMAVFCLSHREVHVVLDYAARVIHHLAEERGMELEDYARTMPTEVLWGIAGVCVGKMMVINGGLDKDKP